MGVVIDCGRAKIGSGAGTGAGDDDLTTTPMHWSSVSHSRSASLLHLCSATLQDPVSLLVDMCWDTAVADMGDLADTALAADISSESFFMASETLRAASCDFLIADSSPEILLSASPSWPAVLPRRACSNSPIRVSVVPDPCFPRT